MAKNFEGSAVLTQDVSLSCAWCNQEQGIPQGNGSHGACEAHAQKMLQEHQARKARKGRQ